MNVVVVTGGTVRLGLAIAEHLRSDGWRVITTSHRADAGADIIADLADPSDAERLFCAATALNGGLPPDALVNNAACFTGDAEILRQVNFKAPQALMRLMSRRASGRGSVVNILDSRVMNPDRVTTPYEKSKRALLSETSLFARVYADTLRVNGVAPGPVLIPTDLHVKAPKTPLGRPTPVAVAEAVGWLLKAPFTTGCIIPVDGGACASGGFRHLNA